MRQGAAIVFVSSQMGHGVRLRSVYCATKHAIEGLTKALALELADSGIRVVSVAPTFVRTAMTAEQLDDSPAAGSFVFEDLHDPASHEQILAVSERACRAIAAAEGCAGGRRPPRREPRLARANAGAAAR